jgi:hypothetical protein
MSDILPEYRRLPIRHQRSLGAASGGEYVALTLGFDFALVEELHGLLVKLLLATGVLTALEDFAFVVVAVPLHHHEIAANHH